MQLDLDRPSLHDQPFPHLRQQRFLEPRDFEALAREFPDEHEVQQFQNVMGGRRRLASDELPFYDFLRSRPAWQSLYEAVNSRTFVASLLARFGPQTGAYGGRIREPFEFDPHKMRRLAELRIRERRPLRRLARGVQRLAGREPTLLTDPIPPPPDRDRIYVHFDISSAYNGYWREVHTDLPNRIAAFLIYFSGAEECGGAGGEFAVHRFRGDRPLWELPRQPEDEQTELVELVRPERNLFLAFLSTRNSYHSVPRIRDAHGWRKFIYVGVTVDRETIWTEPPSAPTADDAARAST